MLTGGPMWLSVTVGSVAFGEAMALMAWTNLRRGGRSSWATAKNNAFLAADVVTGGALIALPFAAGSAATAALWAAVACLAATHAYRAAEYLRHEPNAFCANESLFAVDMGKLAGAVLLAALLALR